ncbi:OmpA family protein [Cryomorpha ignava]|uniref:OmpA family protein n=1 Tax=Cryomorpha ignava TaxID=101383 RepID=A0A7K3WQL9_9FLAO|nr:OmpA family protein [Cryomorpha ignava]NEN23182.1 OmpA family protein [Cryomorpha ignava]
MSKKIPVGKFLFKLTNIWVFRNWCSLLKIGFFAAALLVGYQANAQDQFSISNTKAIRSYKNAQTAFDQRNYDLALAFIVEALEKEANFIEAYFFRFEVYSEMGDLPNAEIALEKGVELNPDFFPNAWYFLGAVEFSQGKYAEAKPHFVRFNTYRGVNPEMVEVAEKHILNCDFAVHAITNPVDFKPINMGEAINTDSPEYYPCISADGETFIYTRLDKDPMAFRGKNENFYVSSNREGIWFPAFPLRSVNSIFNEGAPTLSADGRMLVFTACELMGDYGSDRKGYGSCDLFISIKEGNEWQKPINIGAPINSPYWETQPSLSSDGNTLYFVRGTPSRTGVKNQDIYFTTKNVDGSWAEPKLVSNKINTPGKEESVHIHPDGKTLYFSSNGHVGMGGLDLYISRKDENGAWGEPVNLGYPINTYADENSVLVSSGGALAYYSSDREGGFGDLDLYTFELPDDVRPTPVGFARGRVTDAETGKAVAAKLDLANLNNDERMSFTSDSRNGQFLVALSTGSAYAMTVKAEGYLIHSETFTMPTELPSNGYAVDVKLNKIKEGTSIVLKNVFFDLDKDVLKPQSIPELKQLANFLKSNPNLRIEVAGFTDNQGDDAHNADLSNRRALAVKDFLVKTEGIDSAKITTKGYGAANPIASNDTEEGRAKNRRTEFKVIGMN